VFQATTFPVAVWHANLSAWRKYALFLNYINFCNFSTTLKVMSKRNFMQ